MEALLLSKEQHVTCVNIKLPHGRKLWHQNKKEDMNWTEIITTDMLIEWGNSVIAALDQELEPTKECGEQEKKSSAGKGTSIGNPAPNVQPWKHTHK